MPVATGAMIGLLNDVGEDEQIYLQSIRLSFILTCIRNVWLAMWLIYSSLPLYPSRRIWTWDWGHFVFCQISSRPLHSLRDCKREVVDFPEIQS